MNTEECLRWLSQQSQPDTHSMFLEDIHDELQWSSIPSLTYNARDNTFYYQLHTPEPLDFIVPLSKFCEAARTYEVQHHCSFQVAVRTAMKVESWCVEYFKETGKISYYV